MRKGKLIPWLGFEAHTVTHYVFHDDDTELLPIERANSAGDSGSPVLPRISSTSTLTHNVQAVQGGRASTFSEEPALPGSGSSPLESKDASALD